MFDWNDEELTDIIWGEAGESDDHIVPYPEASEDYCKKKEWSQKADTLKSTGQKVSQANIGTHGRKLESSSNFEPSEGTCASGFDMDSWPNLASSPAAKTDQDSLDTSVSNDLTAITKLDSSGGETAQLDRESEMFQNPHEAKEQCDFVDYGWANIGSFDDLDRIFSNDDPIFGNVSLGNADELWSSSKDMTNSPVKSFPLSVDSPSLGLGALRNTSEHFDIKTEYVQEDDQLFAVGYSKVNDSASHGLQNAHGILDHMEYAGDKSKPVVKQQAELTKIGKNTTTASQLTRENVTMPNELANKGYKHNKILKNRKKLEERSELNSYQDLYGNWSSSGNPSGEFKNQFAPRIVQSSPSPVLNQQRQLQGPESLQYQQISNPFVAPSAYGSITNTYCAMPVLSQIQSGEIQRQPLLSGYEASSDNANPVNKLVESLVKPQIMTPQEKIEKLRRRQQLQAMLAIQKQQQQFGHQVSCSDPSVAQKYPQGTQIQQAEGADLEVEDLTTLPSFDPNSPIEQDDSNTISLAVNDYSVEDTIIYRLQEIISKLDVRIRLCIRDSLFRLAQSTMQRHYASDTSSTNNSCWDEQVVTKEEPNSQSRNAKIPEVETETNPIDRTVAHLLFHRPLELSGKHPDTPESPVSTTAPCEYKAAGIAKLSMGCLRETPRNKQNFSHQGSKNSCSVVNPQPLGQYRNNVCLDTSDNASNNGPADEGAREVDASQ